MPRGGKPWFSLEFMQKIDATFDEIWSRKWSRYHTRAMYAKKKSACCSTPRGGKLWFSLEFMQNFDATFDEICARKWSRHHTFIQTHRFAPFWGPGATSFRLALGRDFFANDATQTHTHTRTHAHKKAKTYMHVFTRNCHQKGLAETSRALYQKNKPG